MTERFQSRLAPDLERFLAFRRALGCTYRRQAYTLRCFDRYVAEHAPRRGPLPIKELLQRWLARKEGRKSITIASDLAPIRGFLTYRRRFDPGGFVPDGEWSNTRSRSSFVPHVPSVGDVRKMLSATAALSGPRFRAQTVRTLILILYCTGLRLGEAARLRVADVDLRQHLFVVRDSKGKTRLVPFRGDLARVLHRYRQSRPASGEPTGAFLLRPDGTPYLAKRASVDLRWILRHLGLKPLRGRVGPRPYDLRHAYAVHRLTRWYRSGVNLQDRLAWLSAYMGHDDLLGTEVYLHSTPELLGMASRRFMARLQETRM